MKNVRCHLHERGFPFAAGSSQGSCFTSSVEVFFFFFFRLLNIYKIELTWFAFNVKVIFSICLIYTNSYTSMDRVAEWTGSTVKPFYFPGWAGSNKRSRWWVLSFLKLCKLEIHDLGFPPTESAATAVNSLWGLNQRNITYRTSGVYPQPCFNGHSSPGAFDELLPDSDRFPLGKAVMPCCIY